MKTLTLFHFICILFICETCFISCKKSPSETQPDQQFIVQNKILNPEQAFPNDSGETFKTKFNGQDIYVEKKSSHYIWMGDIVFDQKTFDSLNKAGTSNRTFRNEGVHEWTYGRVYFTIATGFSANEQTMINNAIQNWRGNSTLTFIQRTNQPNFVLIRPGTTNSGLYSDYVGMKGGQQIINLQNGVFNAGSVIHEMGHVIGFHHEQCRADRNNSIVVNYNNVSPHTTSNIYQFQTYTEQGQPGAQLGIFDFGSIMLYGSFDFSDNVHPVMTRLNGTTFVGQRTALSTGDIETSNFIYGPPYAKVILDITSSYYDPNDADFDEEGDVIIGFFSDVACTIPANLTVSKKATIKNMIQSRTNGSNQSYSINTTYTLNSGSSSYTVGHFHNFDDSYRGVSNNYEYNNYTVLSGFGRY